MGIGLYVHTLDYPFNFDSIVYIQDNPLIRDFAVLCKLPQLHYFSTLDEIYSILPDVTTNMMLRPVAYFSFFLNYYFDGVDPDGYRLVNILLHSFNSSMVFLFLSMLLRNPIDSVDLDVFSKRFIPAFTAALFLLHPIQTESVIYSIQRITLLATAFLLLSLHMYLCFVTLENRKSKIVFRVLSVVLLLAGMLTKEILFVVPVLIILLEMVVFRTTFIASIRKCYWHILLMPVVPLLVMAVSAAQNGSRFTLGGMFSVNNLNGYSSVDYAITQLEVIVSYIRLLIIPLYQNVDYDVQLHRSLIDLHILMSSGVILALCVSTAVILKRHRNYARSRLMLFGVAWFFIAISITSSIVPLPDLKAEHRVYEASIGLLLFFACLVDMLRERYSMAWFRVALVSASVTLCLVLCGLTYARSLVWQSGFSLWQDSLKKAPENERAWHALGLEYLDKKDFIQAELYLKKAISLNPSYLKPYLTLGVMYSMQRMYDEEIEVYLTGLSRNPSSPELLENLGTAYAQNGQLTESVSAFEEALKVNPISRYSLRTLSTVRQMQHSLDTILARPLERKKGFPST